MLRRVRAVNQQRLLTLALFAATQQPVFCGFADDVHPFSRLHRQLFAGPLFVAEGWDDGHLVQHPDLPFVLTQGEKRRTFRTTIGLSPLRRCRYGQGRDLAQRKGQTLNFFLNSFSSFSIFFCFFGSTSAALFMNLNPGRLQHKTGTRLWAKPRHGDDPRGRRSATC